MKNNRGSILVVTTAFVFGFTALGVASIYMAGEQNKFAKREIISTQAFWLADGGLQRVKNQPPALFPASPTPTPGNSCNPCPTIRTANSVVSLGSGSYDVSCYQRQYYLSLSTNTCQPYTHRWIADVQGSVNNQKRFVKAIISDEGFDITNAIEVNGSIPANGGHPDSNINGTYEQNAGITFEGVFGVTKSYVFNMVGVNQYNNGNVPSGAGYSGVSYITSPNGISYSGSNVLQGSGFLIVDCGSYTGTCVDLKKGSFSGIIWIAGNADISGSTGGGVGGAVFVEGTASAPVTGSSLITYNDTAVYDAIGYLPGGHPATPIVVSWSETSS